MALIITPYFKYRLDYDKFNFWEDRIWSTFQLIYKVRPLLLRTNRNSILIREKRDGRKNAETHDALSRPCHHCVKIANFLTGLRTKTSNGNFTLIFKLLAAYFISLMQPSFLRTSIWSLRYFIDPFKFSLSFKFLNKFKTSFKFITRPCCNGYLLNCAQDKKIIHRRNTFGTICPKLDKSTILNPNGIKYILNRNPQCCTHNISRLWFHQAIFDKSKIFLLNKFKNQFLPFNLFYKKLLRMSEYVCTIIVFVKIRGFY